MSCVLNDLYKGYSTRCPNRNNFRSAYCKECIWYEPPQGKPWHKQTGASLFPLTEAKP